MNILKYLIEGLDIGKIIENDGKFYRSTLKASDTVNPNVSLPTDFTVSNRGVFILLAITGKFTTIIAGDPSTDNGQCNLAFTMKNNNGRVYVPDPVSMDIFFTPGRVSQGFLTSGGQILPSNPLAFPGMFFATVWRPKDIITVTVNNASNYSQSWEMAFHGLWVTKDYARYIEQ